MDPTETYARDGRLAALFGQPVAVPCDTPAVYATGAALFLGGEIGGARIEVCEMRLSAGEARELAARLVAAADWASSHPTDLARRRTS